MWVVMSRLGRFYPRGKRIGTHCTGGWVGPRAGLNWSGKCRPCGVRTHECPSHSEALYPTTPSRVHENYNNNIPNIMSPQKTNKISIHITNIFRCKMLRQQSVSLIKDSSIHKAILCMFLFGKKESYICQSCTNVRMPLNYTEWITLKFGARTRQPTSSIAFHCNL
jgi:hypothetical protein